ncbi:group II intron reverse transcriptase/maturase [Metabacillus fastidiosus]|uniref:group II intron reverse transcriptase/maturase n=1 Tax=Metabacillus fastidiosus TaxID=1458 RepID=UPI003D29F145
MNAKKKLRHNEYYGVQDILDNLYSKSQEGKKFYNLIELMATEENIRLAYRNIKRNTGSKTKGTDGITIQDIEKLTVDEVVTKIRDMFHFYRPQPVRRKMIPKPNGKERPLGIPTMWDRLFQQCILQILEPICEAKFHPHSYGFRPNRNTKHAIARVTQLINITGTHFCVDVDIKGFFDNVNHGKLLKQMWAMGIRDKKLLSIISTMLKAEISGEGKPFKGTPQGGILSPLLSNIVLNELDWWVGNQWENFPAKCVRGINKGKPYSVNDKKYRALRTNSKLKEVFIVRYADDFKILCRTAKQAKLVELAVKDFLKTRLKLECAEDKSKIVNLKKRYSEFLGIQLKVTLKNRRTVAKKVRKAKTLSVNPKRIKTTKRSRMQNRHSTEYDRKWVVTSNMTEKAKNNVVIKIKEAIKAIQRNPDRQRVSNFNSVIYGIQNYYNMATNITVDLSDIDYLCRKTLENRLKDRWSTVKDLKYDRYLGQRYAGYNWKKRGVQNKVLAPIFAQKHVSPMNLGKDVCNFTIKGRQAIHEQLVKIDPSTLHYVMSKYNPKKSIEYNDNRISKFISQNGKCAISKEKLGIHGWECHHIVPYRKSRDDSYQNLIILVDSIHKMIRLKDDEKLKQVIHKYSLNGEQIEKINTLREFEDMPPIKVAN